MVLAVRFDQPAGIHMGIDLCGIYTGMPQKTLHYTQVHPRFQKVRSKAVTKCVGADIMLDPCSKASLL